MSGGAHQGEECHLRCWVTRIYCHMDSFMGFALSTFLTIWDLFGLIWFEHLYVIFIDLHFEHLYIYTVYVAILTYLFMHLHFICWIAQPIFFFFY